MLSTLAGYLRRNALALLTVILWSGLVTHYILSHCENMFVNINIREGNGPAKEAPMDVRNTENVIKFPSRSKTSRSSSEYQRAKWEKSKSIQEEAVEISEKQVSQSQQDKWSDEWPRINLHNCSHIEYMNRGINSTSQITTYPQTGIISFPGSGSTWMRHLIQQATGLWTGSVYKNEYLYNQGFLAELDDCDDGGTVAIKAHFPAFESQEHCKFERAVIVIRDPFRAIVAEFNWRATGEHTGVADPRLYRTKLWKEHVMARSKKWFNTTKTWLERFHDEKKRLEDDENPFVQTPDLFKKLLLVSYERLKENVTREMERVVKFLGVPEFRKHCVQDVDGNFRRASNSSESIECLFKKIDLKKAVQKRVDSLAKFVRKLRMGNITSEFEGIGGENISERCKRT